MEVVGIDHGFGNMKTRHCLFTSGIKASIVEPPIRHRVLKYKGKYYMIGGERVELKEKKSNDMDYYLLTLAALAEELRVRGLSKAEVYIGAGLPLTRMGAEKKVFLKYLLQERELNFSYEGIRYQILVKGADIFPQGYAAIVPMLPTFTQTTVLVDMGSWTIDIVPIVDQVPDLSRCKSPSLGTITLTNEINESLRQKFGGEAEESAIREIMQQGKSKMPAKYQNIIKASLSDYAQRILGELRSQKFNLDLLNFVFIGGGAVLLKHFLPEQKPNFTILDNIHINAIGYEDILKKKLGA